MTHVKTRDTDSLDQVNIINFDEEFIVYTSFEILFFHRLKKIQTLKI